MVLVTSDSKLWKISMKIINERLRHGFKKFLYNKRILNIVKFNLICGCYPKNVLYHFELLKSNVKVRELKVLRILNTHIYKQRHSCVAFNITKCIMHKTVLCFIY